MEKLYGLSYEVKELRSKSKIGRKYRKELHKYKQRISTKNKYKELVQRSSCQSKEVRKGKSGTVM